MPHACNPSNRGISSVDPVVVVGKVAGRGSLPISSRYSSSRTLEMDYRLESKVVGSGMSGPVRLASGRVDGRKYAVKSFKKTGMSAIKREELKSETEIYLSLDHPHVARLEMVYETESDLHLVMEYMAGGELYDRLAEKRQYTEEATAEATHQMLLAVAYLHAHKIAHRDLKLENFLYVDPSSSDLKIIDFGFAKFANEGMTQACGSIHYVAPEVLAHCYNEKADIWSIGVIVYMLLTGNPPFHGTDDEVLRKIKSGNVRWSSRYHKLSPLAKDFVTSLLELDPGKRFSAQDALDHPWIKERHRASEVVLHAGIVDNLRKFAHASQFRRNVLSMMAWSMSAEDRIKLRQLFLSIDHGKVGTIRVNDFKNAFCKQFNIDVVEAEELFKRVDTDNNQEIEYTEFLAAALVGHAQVHGDVLRKTFASFDRNSDGSISCDELKCVLGDTFSDQDIEDLLEEADTSGDGKLDFDEFLAYFEKNESRVERTNALQRPGKFGEANDHRRQTASVQIDSSGAGCRTKAATALAKNSLPTLLNNLRAGFRGKV